MKDNMKKVLAGLMVALMLLSGSAMFALAEETGAGTPSTTEQQTQTDGGVSQTPESTTDVNEEEEGEPTGETPDETGETTDGSGETTDPTSVQQEEPVQKVIHIVTLFDADGFLFMSRPMESGSLMPKPQDGPAPDGYRFLYWYDVRDLEMNEFDFEATPITENLELWAFVEFIPEVEEPVEPEPDPIDEDAGYDPQTDNTGDNEDDTNTNNEGNGNTDDSTGDGGTDNVPGTDIRIIDNDTVDPNQGSNPETETTDEETTDDTATEPEVERKVIIRSNAGAVIQAGDTITLMAELVGFDGLEYTLQWQINDGNGWVDVEGAHDVNYSFVVDEFNVNYGWRLRVSVADGEEA